MSVVGSSDLIGRAQGGRKLIAVVYADMVGYSRLIGLDDLGTLDRLRALRSTLIDPAIDEHGGRIVQTGGDSLLIVFDSIDGAVRCAVKIQRQVPDHDGDQPRDRLIRFRVGINIGDVIADGTDLHGDGVNVTARLQAECPPGGVCVSRAVRDHVHGRLDLVFEELGTLSLKNISRPVEAFLLRLHRATTEPRQPSPVPVPHASVRPAKLPRLSIMVAPLRNLGVPQEHEYLVESISEDIASDLEQLFRDTGPFLVDSPEALRRASNTTSPRDVARQLGLAYVVHGSVRGVVDRLTLNLQLVDVETGAHLWFERFDTDLNRTTDSRDEILGRVPWMVRKLREDVNRRIEALPPEDWNQDDLVMRGFALLLRPMVIRSGLDPDRHESLRCFEQALSMVPGSVPAKLGIASVLILQLSNGQSRLGGSDEVRAEQLFEDVLSADGHAAGAHIGMGILRRLQGQLNDSLIELQVALELAPNNYLAISQIGMTLTLLGLPKTAIPFIERSLRLSPHDYLAPISRGWLGLCSLLLGEVEGAITSLKTARATNPRLFFVHWWLAAALGLNGEEDEAGAAFRQAIDMNPDLVAQTGASLMRACPEFVALFEKTVYTGLRRAGLPDVWAGTNERPAGWTGRPS
jgi:adenylate cyclase